MPIKRSYKKRRPTIKKRTMRPRAMIPRQPTYKVGLYNFKRWAQGNPNNFTLIGAAGFAPYQGALTFQLSDVANVSDFSNLFDHYRINKVVVRFWLRSDPGAQAAAGATYPKLYSVIDYDDSGLLSQTQMREHPNCRIRAMNPNRPIVIAFTPATLQLTYLSAVASTFTPQFKKFVDMANTGVPHYGLKFNIDDLTNTNYRVDVETCYYISCKGVR